MNKHHWGSGKPSRTVPRSPREGLAAQSRRSTAVRLSLAFATTSSDVRTCAELSRGRVLDDQDGGGLSQSSSSGLASQCSCSG